MLDGRRRGKKTRVGAFCRGQAKKFPLWGTSRPGGRLRTFGVGGDPPCGKGGAGRLHRPQVQDIIPAGKKLLSGGFQILGGRGKARYCRG